MAETIESEVPFGAYLNRWLRMNPDQAFAVFLKESHQYDPAYLAWQAVRKSRNPYFVNGTGFEGYLVGVCRTPDEALARLLDIGATILASVGRIFRYQPAFRTRLMQTLRNEINDARCISEWAAQLGATLARLRCNVYTNREAITFQYETYHLVKALPPILYREVKNTLFQVYLIPSAGKVLTARTVVSAAALKPADQDAWLVAETIGRFGHPLIREFVRYAAP
ncbi:MAG TPA: hypothetical protein VMT34_05175 [Aggregatilineales bacterium]|nr:hypothetical protein [Aggregatilineales bacterium]